MPVDHLAPLLPDTAAVAAALRAAGPGAGVPGCPQWVLRDLVHHLARVHAWAAEVVRTGDRSPFPALDLPDDALADALEQGAADLHAVLAAADPDTPCWTFAGPGTVAFWRRRQALETAVHRVDAQCAATGTADPVPDDLAEDGVDEVVRVFHPRQVAAGRAPAPGAGVALVSSTTGRRWTVGPEPVVATLEALPGELLLVVWGRLAPGPVEGDAAAVSALLAGGLTA